MLELLNKLNKTEFKPFVAPILEARTNRVFTRANGFTCQYMFTNLEPGWYEFSPESANVCKRYKDAPVAEVVRYLAELPRFYVQAVHPVSEYTWLVVPYNASDATQRGWADCQPRPMHLITDRVKPFDVLVSRSLAGELLYDHLDDCLPESVVSSYVLRNQIAETGIVPDAIRPEQAVIWQIVNRRRAEERKTALQLDTGDRLKWFLDFAGAGLVDWQREGENLRVTYEYNGAQFSPLITRKMQVLSAGICLASGDRRQNLTSLVEVMEEARRLKQYDVNREDWL